MHLQKCTVTICLLEWIYICWSVDIYACWSEIYLCRSVDIYLCEGGYLGSKTLLLVEDLSTAGWWGAKWRDYSPSLSCQMGKWKCSSSSYIPGKCRSEILWARIPRCNDGGQYTLIRIKDYIFGFSLHLQQNLWSLTASFTPQRIISKLRISLIQPLIIFFRVFVITYST